MSKQRRGPEPIVRSTPEAHAVDHELAVDHGNQAASERIPASPDTCRATADRAALALRVAPRDPAWTDRLVAIVERSGLSAERRELVTLRLRTDQGTADDVAAIVQTWLGRDGDALRTPLIAALDAVPETVPERQLATAVSARTGLSPDAVGGLCRDLVLLVAFVWDEDEAWAPAGDYLAEESGT